ncbi:ketopantoate reductase family protein [Peptoniphilus equinus]|uniref:2-dehydropantoate 2-reductase n=1 Tax=Peptoniphilus equinus TaxID=3016343 RepID=A0ABY7QUF8_9FIRM|nr:ketopantoate reductase family protein [Peptoniphilus equinus]WBW50420.1 ketopantoate reductase family protein [Peptoniphilus equinus]
MKIAVLGAGAMGSIYAGHLSQNNEVYVIDVNQEIVDRINSQGMLIEENGEVNSYYPKAHVTTENLPEVDLLLVFVKSIYSETALENNKHLIGNNTIIMTLQNGAGHEKLLSKFVPEDRIIIGTTEDNGAVLASGNIRRGGDGKTNIGTVLKSATINLNEIKEVFDKAGFQVNINSNIQQLIWNKLIINASLSVVTGVLQCSIGDIARNEYAWEMTVALFEEVIKTGEAQGLKFDWDIELEKVRKVSIDNPNGYTSIYQDIKNLRRTEVDTISGAVVNAAHKLGVEVPISEFVVNMVHALEKNNNKFIV